MEDITFQFNCEKRAGLGEDSNPLLIVDNDNNYCAVGVFDGMGGSGAKECTYNGETHTQAYAASRIVRDASEKYFKNTKPESVTSEGLKECLAEALKTERENNGASVSKLKSSLIREYPTTLAIVSARLLQDSSYEIISYSAGDSRNYLWTKDGFYQLSKDDLEENNDPQENLTKDSPLSNCVCADRKFIVEERKFTLNKEKTPFIIFSATDGCYGYLKSIMHLPKLFVDSLKESSDIDDWKSKIEDKLKAVTGDDMSMSFSAVGFENFEDLKNSFKNFEIYGFKRVNETEERIKKIQYGLAEAQKSLEKEIEECWKDFKQVYLEENPNKDVIKKNPTRRTNRRNARGRRNSTRRRTNKKKAKTGTKGKTKIHFKRIPYQNTRHNRQYT